MPLDETTYKLVMSFAIILSGYVLSKIAGRIVTRFWRKKRSPGIESVDVAQTISLAINVAALVLALSFLKISVRLRTVAELYEYAPFILSAVLLGILIILSVRLLFYALDKFLSTSGIMDVVEESGHAHSVALMLVVVRYSLYIVLGVFALELLGVNTNSATAIFRTVFYPLLILGAALLFFGLRPFVENFFAGLFFRRMNFLRAGEQVMIGKDAYTIDTLNAQGAILKGKGDFKNFVPYKTLYGRELRYREVVYDLATLESIKNSFLAQQPSYCGPASASMVLSIFGYDISQEEIGRLARTVVPPKTDDGATVSGGANPRDIIRAVEKLTRNGVKGAWIGVDEITDLKAELKTWLDNKALVIIDYKKSFLFPEAKKAHYSVCISVKGDEMLILDPSSKKGGVYFADIKPAYLGMNTYSEGAKEKRGYIVLAPRGTPAYHRIEKGLVYSSPDLYKQLSNSLTKELDRLIGKSEKLEVILPKSIKKIIEEHKKKEKVTRLWSPAAV